jgi:hypothetical protein
MTRKQSGSEWLKNTWRPMMAILYFAVCIADFIIFPAFWPALQTYMEMETLNQWEPTTLQGGALFHIAMGAILGVSAWTRGAEKLAQQRRDKDE